MNLIQKKITKKAECNVLDITFTTLNSIKKDITKRLAKQKKTLDTWKDNWDGKEMVEESIISLQSTLNAINEIKL